MKCTAFVEMYLLLYSSLIKHHKRYIWIKWFDSTINQMIWFNRSRLKSMWIFPKSIFFESNIWACPRQLTICTGKLLTRALIIFNPSTDCDSCQWSLLPSNQPQYAWICKMSTCFYRRSKWFVNYHAFGFALHGRRLFSVRPLRFKSFLIGFRA